MFGPACLFVLSCTAGASDYFSGVGSVEGEGPPAPYSSPPWKLYGLAILESSLIPATNNTPGKKRLGETGDTS